MRYWGITDPGCVRSQNQDTYIIERIGMHSLLCVVCDGMGGAKSGNVASSIAAEVFAQEVVEKFRSNMTMEQVERLLQTAVGLANRAVYEKAGEGPDFEGMGTTLTAVLVYKRQVLAVNVGDSRIYRVDDTITQITEDHSLVQMMLRQGEISREQARNYPGRNYITRAIGTDQQVDCDIFHMELERGNCLLLCSDGLSNLVDPQEMLFEIRHGGKMDTCCARLRDLVISRGAPDNVTAVLVRL
jgi:protein phosphatase